MRAIQRTRPQFPLCRGYGGAQPSAKSLGLKAQEIVKPPAKPPHRKPALREGRLLAPGANVQSKACVFNSACAQLKGLARNPQV